MGDAVNNQTRPGRDQIAESRFDVPPHWRWAWDGLFALYIPYAGDGWRIPNLAPGYGHLALTHEATPVYSARGSVMTAAYARAWCLFPNNLYNRQLGSTRFSLLWAGYDTRANGTGSPYTGYFGVNAGVDANPNHTLGIERNGDARNINFISSTSGGGALAVQGVEPDSELTAPLCIVGGRSFNRNAGTSMLHVMAKRTENSGFYGLGIRHIDNDTGDTNWGGTPNNAVAHIFLGNRYTGSAGNPGITTSVSAMWFNSFSFNKTRRLHAEPFAPFTKWKRMWAGTLGNTLAQSLAATDGVRARTLTNGATLRVRLG
jgi:hypothetical protein